MVYEDPKIGIRAFCGQILISWKDDLFGVQYGLRLPIY
jgi:hypothetical protein